MLTKNSAEEIAGASFCKHKPRRPVLSSASSGRIVRQKQLLERFTFLFPQIHTPDIPRPKNFPTCGQESQSEKRQYHTHHDGFYF